MASDKYLQLKEMSDADLQSELKETSAQYQRLKFDHAIKGLDNPIGLREVRRDIARLKTEIRSRQIAQLDEKQIAKRSKMRARRRKS
ncbi:MAG: 50S ribosomal protein L29 [Saprospiraceae bacterium]|nr:50S ribosomal protein L29 [Saprospiraceae bacterium]